LNEKGREVYVYDDGGYGVEMRFFEMKIMCDM